VDRKFDLGSHGAVNDESLGCGLLLPVSLRGPFI